MGTGLLPKEPSSPVEVKIKRDVRRQERRDFEHIFEEKG